MRVLICGGRDFDDYHSFWYSMNDISDKFDFDNKQPITIIQGGAKGADAFARTYAIECGFELENYEANWSKYGRSAGYIRNAQMLEEGKPDLVIAFPGGKGTAMMVKLAQKAKIKVIKIE
jgi:hypothetical protein